MKRKLFSAILSLTLVAAFSVSAFAAGGEPAAVDANPGEAITRSFSVTDEVASGFIASPADTVADLEKLAVAEELDTGIAPRAASWTQLPGTYYVYAQTTSYNCGPATVQAVLRYLNGSTPSQSTVATGCKTTTSGTTLANMVSYANSQQSSNSYVVATISNRDAMDTRLYGGINTMQAPPMLGLAFSSSDGWDYNTSGHAMSVYAAMSDKSAYMVADPWIGYSGLSGNSWYSRTSSQLYKALLGLAW